MTKRFREQQHVADRLGMIDYQHYLEFKEHAVSGLMLFGDKFLEALGLALSEADDSNAVKIIHIWRNECSTHEILHKMYLAKNIALDNQLADTIIL